MSDDLKAFREKIEMMRELGVTEADGIKLGAPPAAAKPEETADQMRERLAKARQREHDIMFAHSATKPLLRAVK